MFGTGDTYWDYLTVFSTTYILHSYEHAVCLFQP